MLHGYCSDISNTNSNITLSKSIEIRRLDYINSISSFDVQLKEKQHASVMTAASSINNQSNPTLKEYQKQNSANHFNSASSEKQGQLKNKQLQETMINSTDLSGLTSEKRNRIRLLIGCWFSTVDNNISNIQIHPMKIDLKDDIPV